MAPFGRDRPPVGRGALVGTIKYVVPKIYAWFALQRAISSMRRQIFRLKARRNFISVSSIGQFRSFPPYQVQITRIPSFM